MVIWTLWSFMKGEAAREWHNTPHFPWVSSCTWYKETVKRIHVCLHVIPEEMIKLLKPNIASFSWDSSLQGGRFHVRGVVGESRHLSKLHESKAETFKPRPSTHAFRFGAPIWCPSRRPVISPNPCALPPHDPGLACGLEVSGSGFKACRPHNPQVPAPPSTAQVSNCSTASDISEATPVLRWNRAPGNPVAQSLGVESSMLKKISESLNPRLY